MDGRYTFKGLGINRNSTFVMDLRPYWKQGLDECIQDTLAEMFGFESWSVKVETKEFENSDGIAVQYFKATLPNGKSFQVQYGDFLN